MEFEREDEKTIRRNPQYIIEQGIILLRVLRDYGAEIDENADNALGKSESTLRKALISLACECFLKGIQDIRWGSHKVYCDLGMLFESLDLEDQKGIEELWVEKGLSHSMHDLLKLLWNSLQKALHFQENTEHADILDSRVMFTASHVLEYYSVSAYIGKVRERFGCYQEALAKELLKCVLPSTYGNLRKNDSPSKSPDFVSDSESYGVEVTTGLASAEKYKDLLEKFGLPISKAKSELFRFIYLTFGRKIPRLFKDVMYENLPDCVSENVNRSCLGVYSVLSYDSLGLVISSILIKYKKLNSPNSSYDRFLNEIDLFVTTSIGCTTENIQSLKERLEEILKKQSYVRNFKKIWVCCIDTLYVFEPFRGGVNEMRLTEKQIMSAKELAEKETNYKVTGEFDWENAWNLV